MNNVETNQMYKILKQIRWIMLKQTSCIQYWNKSNRKSGKDSPLAEDTGRRGTLKAEQGFVSAAFIPFFCRRQSLQPAFITATSPNSRLLVQNICKICVQMIHSGKIKCTYEKKKRKKLNFLREGVATCWCRYIPGISNKSLPLPHYI